MKKDNATPSRRLLRRGALAGLLAASGVLLSFVSFPVGPARIFPFQHSLNVMTGVLLGPWWALGSACVTSLIRNLMGTGSVFAFPGSMIGAFLAGAAAESLKDLSPSSSARFSAPAAALGEIVGTGIIGAWVCASLLAPAVGKGGAFSFWASSFLMSCVPGAVMGAALTGLLRRTQFLRKFLEQ